MVRKQHLSTAAGLNDLGTTGKEVEENYKRVPEASRSKLCTGPTVSADQQYGSTDVIRGFRICIPFTTGLRGMYDHGADPL